MSALPGESRGDESDYRAYLRREWEESYRHPAHLAAVDAIRRHVPSIARVLDVGMGAGQELIPFLGDAWCCGIDIAEASPQFARERLTAMAGPTLRFAVAQASVEALPFAPGSIDVVICRLVLPYVNHTAALGELARVLRPGGILSLQVHAPRFYISKLRQGIATSDAGKRRHAIGALRTGVWFHLTGRHRPIAGVIETFVTIRMLTRLAGRAGLDVIDQVENQNLNAPHVLLKRRFDEEPRP